MDETEIIISLRTSEKCLNHGAIEDQTTQNIKKGYIKPFEELIPD